MKLVVCMTIFFFTSSSSLSSPPPPPSTSQQSSHSQHESPAPTNPLPRTGVFLNYTRELINFTNSHFTKSPAINRQLDHEDESEAQHLLGDILADEFDNVETGLNDSLEDLEEDENANWDDDDDDDNKERIFSQNRTGRARHDKGQGLGKARGKKGKQQVDVAKYNGYVDAVFKRMNSLIRAKRMDPLRVNLFAGKQQNGNKESGGGGGKKSEGVKNKIKSNGHGGGKRPGQNNKNNNNRKGQNKKNKGKKNKKQNALRRGPLIVEREDDEDEDDRETRRIARSASSNQTMSNKTRPVSMEGQTNRSTSTSIESASSPAPAQSSSSSSSESKEMKETQKENPNRPTRGVLHGLSSLRRAGNVKVLRRGADVRLVRAKFLLGPVALDILPKKSSNGTKSSNMPTATATARSLNGVLEIRLKNAGPTRIRKLRVFPPANVRVEGENKGMKRQSYRKITPVASRKLMLVANDVVRQTQIFRDKPRNNNKRGQPKPKVQNKRRVHQ